jgi:hypothetical protein
MFRKRGNPHWGRPMQPVSILCTEFELQTKELQLAPDQYIVSSRLRKWCEENKNQYVHPRMAAQSLEHVRKFGPQRRRIVPPPIFAKRRGLAWPRRSYP